MSAIPAYDQDYPEVPDWQLDPDVEGPPEVSPPAGDPAPDEPLTELGYARRLVALHGARLRHVGQWGKWLIWTGRRWERDVTGQAHRCAKDVARRMVDLAEAEVEQAGSELLDTVLDGEQKEAKAKLKKAEGFLSVTKRFESARAVTSVLALAATEPTVAVTPEVLDADRHLLNVANGTLDLRSMKLRPHEPGDMLTKIALAAYDPDAVGPTWDAFLARVQPDPQVRDFLARLLGHALLGDVVEHVMGILHGVGANGKSTFVDAACYALGEYAGPADPELITARTFDAHPTGVADLFGLRLALLHETDKGRRLAEGTVKRLTGGDTLKARRMREDFWSFEPSHTFVMLTNHTPLVSGTDEGIWRRLRLVPWDVVIPADERDGGLGDRLEGEADAVLAWMVAGYQQWRRRGLDEPAAVTEATSAWRADSDALGRFLDERCVQNPHVHVRSGELFAAWAAWCEAEREDCGSQKAFTAALVERGLGPPKKSDGVMRWRGVALVTESSER